MDILFSSVNIDVRIMDYDDIPLICKADNDESEQNIPNMSFEVRAINEVDTTNLAVAMGKSKLRDGQ